MIWFVSSVGQTHPKPETSSFCHLACCLYKPSFLGTQGVEAIRKQGPIRFDVESSYLLVASSASVILKSGEKKLVTMLLRRVVTGWLVAALSPAYGSLIII